MNISKYINPRILHRGKVLFYILFSSAMMVYMTSCDEYNYADDNITMASELAITASDSVLTLEQISSDEDAITFDWTTGSNEGTGASISYVLQIDAQKNYFSSDALTYDMGKAVYEQSFTTEELNNILLNDFSLTSNEPSVIEARIIATINSSPVQYDTSNVATITVTPYEPVSTTLYLIGDAVGNDWDVDNAIELTADDDEIATFTYKGAFEQGEFSFITTLGQELPAYGKGTDDTEIVYETENALNVSTFSIEIVGTYKITVDLLDLSITITQMDEPAYSQIFIVGDAAPNGWDIANATELVQDEDNPYVFTYEGVLTAGDFKFPVNQDTDWSQDIYMMASDSTMYLHHGGDSDDSKWTIEKKGYYTITINLSELTISMERTKLYLIGDASPAAWDITNAIEMVEDDEDGCIFTYTGEMYAGDFKFPVNRNSTWDQDTYMMDPDDELKMYRHVGGASDDSKWTISTDGNYVITANIELLTIDIQKQ